MSQLAKFCSSKYTVHNNEYPNVIKITTMGLERLANRSEWESQINKNQLIEKVNKYRIKPKMATQNPNIKRSQKLQDRVHNDNHKTVQRKALKTFYKWNLYLDAINHNIQKQYSKRKNQQLKQYQWGEVSACYKSDISKILQTCSNEINQQKVREKRRLKQLHNFKYRMPRLSNKQNIQSPLQPKSPPKSSTTHIPKIPKKQSNINTNC